MKQDKQTEQPILFTIKDGYAVISLNRPKQLNAFNEKMHLELRKILTEVKENNNIRSLLITGSGRGFCAGQDLGDRDPINQTYDLSETLNNFYNPLIKQIENIEKPKVCAVNGVAAGAGIALALSGDITLASTSAKFAMAFGKIGLVPDSGLTWRLVNLVGLARAKALLLTNAVLTAEEAHNLGLVWRTYTPETLINKAEKLTKQLAHGPSTGTALTIQALNRASMCSLDEALEIEAQFQKEAGYSSDYKEGVTAFLEKRQAVFTKNSKF